MKNTLTITMGLPGSGKSTWAASQQVKHPNTVVVCMDDIRAMLHGERPHNNTDERLTAGLRDHAITMAAKHGRDVIVADTNLAASTRARLRSIADRLGMEFVVNDSFLKVPVDECVARDARRDRPVGRAVIERMVDRCSTDGVFDTVGA